MRGRLSLCLSFVVVSLCMACADESIVAPSPLAATRSHLGAWNAPFLNRCRHRRSRCSSQDSLGTQILENGRRVVRSLPAGKREGLPFQFWERARRWDVSIVFSNGFTGMTMDLRCAGDNYSGTALAFFDFGRLTSEPQRSSPVTRAVNRTVFGAHLELRHDDRIE